MVNNYEVKEVNGGLLVSGLSDFSIAQIFDCGQCFRFDPDRDGPAVSGIYAGRRLTFSQPTPDSLLIAGADAGFFSAKLVRFLSLDVDYAAIKADILSRFDGQVPGDPVIRSAVEIGSGIRILRQDPWETLISFIISSNNNIPRIKQCISSLCRVYGEPFEAGGETFYAFPTPETLVAAGVDGIFALKTGFRAKYIFDAASRVLDGTLSFAEIDAAPGDRASALLQTVKGVGPKVAACVLLFGFAKTDAFPIDVWIKRVLAKYYPPTFSPIDLGPYAGIAQQYLFYYERYVISTKEAS